MASSDLPFHKTLLAGGIAGAAEVLVMYPLDTIKTRAQLHVGPGSVGMVRSMVTMARTEGVLRFYRGLLAPLMQEPIKRSVKFVSNKAYNDLIIGTSKPTLATKAACGFLAGATEAFTISPFEAVKIRMQAKNRVSLYKNSWECAGHTMRTEGVYGFFRGMDASLVRSGVWNGVYFATMYELRKRRTFGDSVFIPGLIGGCLGTVCNQPWDTVAMRVRNAPPTDPHHFPWTHMINIAKNEGPRALYRGFTPKILRLGPGGGLMIVVFEFIADLIR